MAEVIIPEELVETATIAVATAAGEFTKEASARGYAIAVLSAVLTDRALVPAPDLVELPKFQGCTDSDPDRCACGEPALVCEACQEEIDEGMSAYVITVKDAPWLTDDDSGQSWSNVWWHATCDQRPKVGGGSRG